ncbi:hypothetical protein PACTADRAFT_48944 [Pachysolen tannophilus NRRL Y-2460]|uniref:PWWP domain-containing protein n=1 Tax=Pachysolen tannophilus NRRL Y-2460 TaxID=669874 RepID=A0A1E4TZM5_PACTA|nr:hypothetical protein PACTADRAFT_48944 [Pachysolen tannophilus NRRL Y-2460]
MSSKNQFKPGQLVYSKIQGFPKWPAVIVPEDLVPVSVLDSKPTRDSKNFYPVFFLGSEPSYYWNRYDSLSPLDVEECEKSLKKAKTGLKRALKHATDISPNFLSAIPPINDDTAVDGDQEDLKEEQNEDDEEGENDEEGEGEGEGDVEDDADGDEVGDEESDDEDVKTKRKSSKRKPSTQSTSRDLKDLKDSKDSRKRKPEPKNDDVELSKKSIKKSRTSTPSITENKSDKNSNGNGSKPPENWTDDEKQKNFWFIRTRLQKGLISSKIPPAYDDYQYNSKILNKLEELSSIVDLKVLKGTKLHKVLKAILKIPDLERKDDFKFHERAGKILNEWEPLLHQIRSEKTIAVSTTIEDGEKLATDTKTINGNGSDVKRENQEITEAA